MVARNSFGSGSSSCSPASNGGESVCPIRRNRHDSGYGDRQYRRHRAERQITVTNTQTGVAFQTVTSSAGDYNAPGLNPGTYKVTAEAKGFQKAATSAFTLTVNQHARIDLP